LKALEQAVIQGEAPALHAMLNDRIRCFEGRPQRYGTQFDWNAAGELSPLPIEDPDTVDARRRAIGLGPPAEDLRARRRDIAGTGERPPQDWSARQREMEVWYRQVGWRV
jgi:uncharacterized protein DUF6624